MRRRIIMGHKRLPADYREVEYVESSGGQYFDSGIYVGGQPNIKYYCDFQYTRLTSERQCVMGVDTWDMAINADGRFRIYTDTSIPCYPDRHNCEITLRYENNTISKKMLYDGVIVANYTSSYYSAWNMYVFAKGVHPSVSRMFANVKIFSAKIWKNNAVVRDFVPCYRKADGVIGMYDLVNGIFYTNQGTGTFTKGPDVY